VSELFVIMKGTYRDPTDIIFEVNKLISTLYCVQQSMDSRSIATIQTISLRN